MLRTALLVAGKDLRQRLRDRSALVIAFVAPFVLASIIGLAFGGDYAFKATYAVADADKGPVASRLHRRRPGQPRPARPGHRAPGGRRRGPGPGRPGRRRRRLPAPGRLLGLGPAGRGGHHHRARVGREPDRRPGRPLAGRGLRGRAGRHPAGRADRPRHRRPAPDRRRGPRAGGAGGRRPAARAAGRGPGRGTHHRGGQLLRPLDGHLLPVLHRVLRRPQRPGRAPPGDHASGCWPAPPRPAGCWPARPWPRSSSAPPACSSCGWRPRWCSGPTGATRWPWSP